MPAPLRIAYFSPLPPARSGIADYSAELLPPLAARTNITLFADDPATFAGQGLPVEAIAHYPSRRWEFDLALYQMGNSNYHEQLYRMALRYPGVVVLHDLFLHHFMAHTTAGQGNHAAYAREMRYALGDDGRQVYDEIRLGRRPTPLAEVPLNDRLLDTSLATIVHSEFARERIAEQRPQARTAVIPQLIAHRAGHSRRAELGLPDEAMVFGSVGQVTAARQLPLALRALRNLLDDGIAAHFLVAGEVLPEVDLDGQIAALRLEPYVTQVGYVPTLQALMDWTATMDVVLNLRYPTLGETSASALRAMDIGRPVIVYDHGWYSELPDDAVGKLPAEPDQTALTPLMGALAQDEARRLAMGRAAADYVDRHCRPGVVAQTYVEFLSGLREEWRHGG